MNTTLYNTQGKEKGKIDLPDFFDTKPSQALLHEAVVGYLSNKREGSHSTKTRAEVSGGGTKPWKQKGTGNARSGSIRSPLWRKGGITFGPKPRDYSHKLSKQKKRSSLDMALSLKLQQNNIVVLENVELKEAKTKKVAEIIKNLKVQDSKILFVTEKSDEMLKRASRNLQNFVLNNVKNINAYEVMWADKLIITKDAIEELKKIKEAYKGK